MANNRKTGSEYEEMAAAYMAGHGYTILERNFFTRGGELDIVARDGEYLVFAEVKYRKSAERGGAVYAISTIKQKRIIHAAKVYMLARGISQEAFCRFDAVLIDGDEITLIKDAWQA